MEMTNPSVLPPLALFPWQRCPAVAVMGPGKYSTARCDRLKKHSGWHVAERGLGDIFWKETYPS